MTTLSISAVMNAMAAVAEAQADEATARAGYDGYSWDYHGQRFIDSVDSAKEAAEAVLREYIAQEVAAQVKSAIEAQQAMKP